MKTTFVKSSLEFLIKWIYKNMKKLPIISILFVYFIFSIATLFLWEKRGINTVTGDEPHYLVMGQVRKLL